MRKIAVILFSMGGPDKRDSIKPYLYNFFSDPAIIPLPCLLRKLLARFIAAKRSANESANSYAHIGYRSPLLENTEAQARAISGKLKEKDDQTRFRVFTCMRYWHPRAAEVVQEVKSFDPDQIVLLPMYPQFSTTTSGSSLTEWQRLQEQAEINVNTSAICCYPVDKGFVRTSAKLIKQTYEEVSSRENKQPRLLLSAHGLPEYVIKKGDPYQWQCEQTAEAVIAEMAIPGIDWTLCYQSRVGPFKWTGPDTVSEIMSAARAGRPIIIYTPAFVSDHVETLVEIDIEYREMALSNGAPCFIRVPVAGVHEEFVSSLAEGVYDLIEGRERDHLQCPAKFSKCFLSGIKESNK